MIATRPARWTAMASVLASGAAGLIYQIAWQRSLSRLVGTDAIATATVIAVFLSGLSLGYALCGRWSARARRPLHVYMALEAAIGIWGALFGFLFQVVERVTWSVPVHSPESLAIVALISSGVLILPPTLLMGATVPFMTRILQPGPGPQPEARGTLARVYGINTAGAMAGTLAATFALMPRFGTSGTLAAGASLNFLAAALLLIVIARRGVKETTETGEKPAPTVLHPGGALPISLLAMMSGVAVMIQETALIRFASLVFGGMTYVFGMVVAVFVFGIAAGSLVVARLRRVPAWSVGLACCLSAAGWAGVFFTLDRWPWWAHLIRIGFQENAVGFALYYASVFLFLALMVSPCVVPMGAVLPLLFHEAGADGRTIGRSAGSLLAWNALGSLMGGLAGGFFLFYLIDLGRIMMVGPLIVSLMAVLAIRKRSRPVRAAALAILMICAGLLIARPGFDPSRTVPGTFRIRQATESTFLGARAFHERNYENRRLVSLRDGPVASVAVIEAPVLEIPGLSPLSLYINGKSDSNTAADRVTLGALAHVPALLHPQARRALVIGLGTGVTAGELSLYPDLSRIEVVEISPEVIRALPLFGPHTHRVHEDPRLIVHNADARLFLRGHEATWDLIVSEPSNVWISGMDLLFTREFLESVRDHLGPGGLFIQWLHLYEADCEMIRIILATLSGVFGDLRAFHASQGDLLIVASDREVAIDREAVQARVDALPDVARSLEVIGFPEAGDLLDREVIMLPAILERAAGHPPHTLDSSRLLYLAGRAMFEGRVVQVFDLAGEGLTGACGDS